MNVPASNRARARFGKLGSGAEVSELPELESGADQKRWGNSTPIEDEDDDEDEYDWFWA